MSVTSLTRATLPGSRHHGARRGLSHARALRAAETLFSGFRGSCVPVMLSQVALSRQVGALRIRVGESLGWRVTPERSRVLGSHHGGQGHRA